MTQMKVTLDEVARAAGVSAGTVSRVLNGKNKENRPAIERRATRIRQIAAEMGYRPNAAARSMSRGEHGAVAFVTCSDPGYDWYPRQLVHGIHGALEQRGTRLVFAELPGSGLTDREVVPRLFAETAVDAMLLNLDTKLSKQVLENFEQQRMPGVLLNQQRSTRSVAPDEVQGGRAAAAWLLHLGHKEVGFFKANDPSREPHFSITQRLEGVQSVLSDAGLRSDRVHLGDPDYSGKRGNGADYAERFLERHPSVSAVVCYSLPDALAMAFAAAGLGRRLPDDLRLVVFHDSLSYEQTGIPLDTMLVPFRRVGEAAVGLAYDMVGSDRATRPASLHVPYRELYDSSSDHSIDPGALLG